MKKYLLMAGIATTTIALSACGGGENSGSDSENQNSSNEESESDEENNQEESSGDESSDSEDSEGETMSKEENENQEAQAGDTVESDAGSFNMVKRTDDIGTVETGPLAATFESAKVIDGELTEEYQDILETDSENLTYIQLDMSVENTQEEPVNFYPSQATITTNSGEQLDPDGFLGEHISGEFLDAVTQEGYNVYVLENSEAEEIEEITVRMSAPTDEDFNEVGDSVEQTITFE